MLEQHNEQPETLAPKSKTEVSKPSLDTEERAEKQMEAKLNLLEDAVLAVGKANPAYKMDDFYLGMCELVYADEFPVSKIEKVVDLIDTYPFSKAGAKKFNDLTQAGDYVYLVGLLENNLKCLDELQIIDKSLKGFERRILDKFLAVAGSLGVLTLSISGKGPIYHGCMGLAPDDMSSYDLRILMGPEETSSNQSQRSSHEKMSGAIAATYSLAVSEEELSRQEDLIEEAELKGEENEQANAAFREEYEATKEETGLTIEEFGKDILEEFKVQNEETGITWPQFIAKRSV